MIDLALIEECAPLVHPATMQTLIQTESSGNPFAIGVVGLDLVNQPETKAEAVTSAQNLMDQGYNISVGLAQINMHNFEGLGLTIETAFDPCSNLEASSRVLENCFERAEKEYSDNQEALQAAFSCYYSNNFQRGFKADDANGNSYVGRVARNSEQFRIPAIEFSENTLLEGGGREADQQQREEKREIRAIENTAPNENESESTGSTWDVFSDFSS